MADRLPDPAHDVVELLVGEAATFLSLPGLCFEVADLGLRCLLLRSHRSPLWLCQQSWRCGGVHRGARMLFRRNRLPYHVSERRQLAFTKQSLVRFELGRKLLIARDA